ncbi:SGNH/GDSL hydrolase family protein [Paenibacillus humicola]|uniref:SGNH/GDSL hydrolase family protein n=1 Tax=Paenibacillus humicola TaxID=3110540 RepID=UPI00237BFAB6|nr:SGNH/GDSL hydrolase family protein [Paenibacillus humicola]
MKSNPNRPPGPGYAVLRSGLPRLREKLKKDQPVTIAFLGGSITEGYAASDPDKTSWRALTEQYFREKYPHRTITGINAGVGGTDSAFGAHRLAEHVLTKGVPDLLFVEFAVNDGEDRGRSVQGMEGIVRQMRRLSPNTDICFLYTAADKNMTEGVPFNIAVHEEVAGHYGIPSVNFAAGIRDLVQARRIRFEDILPDRTHPNDEGFALYAGFLREALDAGLGPGNEDADARPAARPGYSLPSPLDAGNYEYGGMQGLHTAGASKGFSPKVLASEPLINWRFKTDHLYADAPGAELQFTVQGSGAGLLLLCGPDSGIFEYAIDGAEFRPVNLFDDWCLNVYRPVIALFPGPDGKRKTRNVAVRNTGMKDERSTGTALRISNLLYH